jgi:hypothetical protein
MRRRKRSKSIKKLGLLFIILILSLATISASYAHWEETIYIGGDMRTTEWEEKTIDPLLIVAFEDLSISIGTGTQGYWKQHPDAWPVTSITIGGTIYSKSQAISIMKASGAGDKTYDMFQQLVAAKLNVIIGCESSCIDQTIADANAWMSRNPVGSSIGGSHSEWQNEGEDLHSTLTQYNEGNLCAPHRDNVEGTNDYDYNDFVVNISVKGIYVDESLIELNFTFEALARGAAYHHDFNLFIPAFTFGIDGEYTIRYYETDGSLLSTATGSFLDISDIDLTIFSSTWNALPPTAGHSWCANAIDCTGIYPGRITSVTFKFEGLFCPNDLDLEVYTLNYIGTHGSNLFFNPYLHVWNTGEIINKGDVRFISVPNDWIWPQERAAIWTVYPFNIIASRGVKSGNPPIFVGEWYEEIPQPPKWDPFC